MLISIQSNNLFFYDSECQLRYTTFLIFIQSLVESVFEWNSRSHESLLVIDSVDRKSRADAIKIYLKRFNEFYQSQQ